MGPSFSGQLTTLVLEGGSRGPSPSPVWLEEPNSQDWYGQNPLWIWASTDLVRCVQVQKAQIQPGDCPPSSGWGSLVWAAQE